MLEGFGRLPEQPLALAQPRARARPVVVRDAAGRIEQRLARGEALDRVSDDASAVAALAPSPFA